MTRHEIRKAAEEMGVMPQAAAAMRIRYLVDDVAFWDDVADDVSFTYALRAIDEIIDLKPMAKHKPRESTITDDMIAQARQVPITRLIDFRQGKARAWCHDDNNPSLFHATRTNRASCPVCAKYFDPIAVLMERDGYSFVDAVKALQGM